MAGFLRAEIHQEPANCYLLIIKGSFYNIDSNVDPNSKSNSGNKLASVKSGLVGHKQVPRDKAKARSEEVSHNFFSPRASLCLHKCGDIETNPGPEQGAIELPTVSSTSTTSTASPSSSTAAVQNLERGKRKVPLQALTYNVRGLSNTRKVRHLVNYCHKQCNKALDSVFMFQETFVEKLDLLNYIWRGEHHLTGGTGQSMGCITLLSSPINVLSHFF